MGKRPLDTTVCRLRLITFCGCLLNFCQLQDEHRVKMCYAVYFKIRPDKLQSPSPDNCRILEYNGVQALNLGRFNPAKESNVNYLYKTAFEKAAF